MPLYQLTGDAIQPVARTSLAAAGLRERQDLQRLLKRHVEVLAPDLLVVAEEFGSWEESQRRIDLLALDRDANLVVIELKRDQSSHMELQALRYAAMVSAMTFEQLVDTYRDFLEREGSDADAREEILGFLASPEAEEPSLGDVSNRPLSLRIASGAGAPSG
jgi:RecB family endonuclease NucS